MLAEIVPELLMPPPKVRLFAMSMPEPFAMIVPLFVESSLNRGVCVNADGGKVRRCNRSIVNDRASNRAVDDRDTGEGHTVDLTARGVLRSPETSALLTLMQLITDELLIGPLLPVTLMAHVAARADSTAGRPTNAVPAIKEISDVVASNPCRKLLFGGGLWPANGCDRTTCGWSVFIRCPQLERALRPHTRCSGLDQPEPSRGTGGTKCLISKGCCAAGTPRCAGVSLWAALLPASPTALR